MDSFCFLAKRAVEQFVRTGKEFSSLQSLPEEIYSSKAGVFVTIKNGEKLRGCVGTYLPTKANIAYEIISSAVSACSQDFRFLPITKEELPELSYEVSVLSKPVPIGSLENHNPQTHGLIVKSSSGKVGLLLPQLEGVTSSDQQLLIACQKAGINPKDGNFEIFEFAAEKHSSSNDKRQFGDVHTI